MSQSLESKAFSGGLALVSRQLFGMGLALVGMLVNTRVLGPHKYGQFAIVVGLMTYAVNVGKLGLDVYLIRYQGDLKPRQFGVTQLIYLLIGSVILVVGIALGPVAAAWYNDLSLRDFFWGYSIVPPMLVMSSAYMALLERRLAYKHVAAIESAGQLLYLCISIPIVLYYRSVWGLIFGALGQSALSLCVSAYMSRMYFHPCWDRKEAKAQLNYGLGYATSTWIMEVRGLASPLVIGKLLGSEAVAFIALATKLITMIGCAKFAIYRIYMSLLARLAVDRTKMKAALEAGLQLQVLVLGISLISFMAVGPELIKNTIGVKWLPVFNIFPFIAIGQIVNGAFSLHSSALYVIGKNREVGLFHLIHIIVFIPATWYLTTMLGNISGYGWAEVAALVSYAWIRHALRKHLFVIRERIIYINMLVAVAGIILMGKLIDGPCWPRLLSCLFVLSGLLFAVQQNRTTCLVILNRIVGRLRLRGA
jgi:O-antigen/teichoic acid export membrane protein